MLFNFFYLFFAIAIIISALALLFAGIFLTMRPLLMLLEAGQPQSLFNALRQGDWVYFGLTGVLSGFLDNAPTFLAFFAAAGGQAPDLMTTHATTLTAISAGAAFFGGLSYIGNAPNLIVQSVARQHGVAMPSFFVFIAWAMVFLMPILAVSAWIFFAAPTGVLFWLVAPLGGAVVMALRRTD